MTDTASECTPRSAHTHADHCQDSAPRRIRWFSCECRAWLGSAPSLATTRISSAPRRWQCHACACSPVLVCSELPLGFVTSQRSPALPSAYPTLSVHPVCVRCDSIAHLSLPSVSLPPTTRTILEDSYHADPLTHVVNARCSLMNQWLRHRWTPHYHHSKKQQRPFLLLSVVKNHANTRSPLGSSQCAHSPTRSLPPRPSPPFPSQHTPTNRIATS